MIVKKYFIALCLAIPFLGFAKMKINVLEKTRMDLASLHSYSGNSSDHYRSVWKASHGGTFVPHFAFLNEDHLRNNFLEILMPAPAYTDTIEINKNVSAGATDTESASVSIVAANTIEQGASATYISGKSLTLISGFHAKEGALFSARIDTVKQLLEHAVKWTDLVGLQYNDRGELEKINAATRGWGRLGAVSENSLASQEDGYFTYKASEGQYYQFIGLSADNKDASYRTIDYAIYLSSGSSRFYIYEQGSYKRIYGSYKKGDSFKVGRKGTEIKYFHNDQLLYSSVCDPQEELFIDLSLYNSVETVKNISASFNIVGCTDQIACNYNENATEDDGSCVIPIGCEICSESTDGKGIVVDNDWDADGICNEQDEHAVRWTDLVGLQYNDRGELEKINAAMRGWGRLGAVSENSLASKEDGYITFATSEGQNRQFIGLSADNKDASYRTIDYAIYLSSGSSRFYIYEQGSYKRIYGSYKKGDSFKVGRKGTEIKYFHNDQLLYSSVCDPQEELFIDLSLYNSVETVKNISASFNIVGCTDQIACNYNENATEDDGSCVIPIGCEICSESTDGKGIVVDNDWDADGICNEQDEHAVRWTDLVGLQYNDRGELEKINAAMRGWGRLGAVSENSLASKEDGYFTYTASEGQYYQFIGLSADNKDASFRTIDYAIYFSSRSSRFFIYEQGSYKRIYGSYKQGDSFKVGRKGTEIKYFHNDQLL